MESRGNKCQATFRIPSRPMSVSLCVCLHPSFWLWPKRAYIFRYGCEHTHTHTQLQDTHA